MGAMSRAYDIRRDIRRFLSLHALSVTLLTALLSGFMTSPAVASLPANSLHRVSLRQKQHFTRITIALENRPHYTLSRLPGNRLRIRLADTDGPLLKKFRRYSDTNLGGVVFSRSGDSLVLTFPFATDRIWRDVSVDGVNAITLDIGTQFGSPLPPAQRSGRDRIWSGVEKLVRDFDPPLKSEFPFVPTDQILLKNLLDRDGQEVFLAAEAALYKGNLSEAEEGFAQFTSRKTAIQPLALYRLGETHYKLQKYSQALSSFREAEKLWPAFLNLNPAVTFYYGDSIARGGDLSAARSLLSGLIARLAEKKFAPVLLVRMADILVRQGHEQEALGVYRTVSENFRDNKATWIAMLRLKDRDFLQATPWNYLSLGNAYLDIYRQSNDIDLREESLFKYVLLESLHGEASDALRQVVMFQRKYPRGVYAAVCRTIREVLVAQVYRETEWARKSSGLILFAEEHQDYLAECMEQPEFLQKIVRAYETAGRPIELIRLLSFLLERQWASAGAPFMYETVAENAELLGDTVMAEKYMRMFLQKFASHPRARLILERLGGLLYSEGRHQETRDTLLWLLNRGEKARMAESYYYLGRSLWALRQFAPAYRSMELYLPRGVDHTGKAARLLPDAYYVAASARESAGDRKGALRLIEAGLKKPDLEGRDELLYKAGELHLHAGRTQRAQTYFEQVATKGSDPDWQNLARHALQTLETNAGSKATP
ncbi:TPR repeat-containing protein [Pelobacter propionicus DSM 2379]|uniref:TPR repeat-containing protein n=2 Tax=Pelobacter propionicus TaxID=29543 RepID=A1AUJ4_PELPD|nr:TPR repeat-containing protein [Pelobacter propionicus DSM 2379]